MIKDRDDRKPLIPLYDPLEVSYANISKGECPFHTVCPYLSPEDKMKCMFRIQDHTEKWFEEVRIASETIVERAEKRKKKLDDLGKILMDSNIAIANVERAKLRMNIAGIKLWLVIIFKQFRVSLAAFKFITKFLPYIIYSGILISLFIARILDPIIETLAHPFFILATLGFVLLVEILEDLIKGRVESFLNARLNRTFFQKVPVYEQALKERYP